MKQQNLYRQIVNVIAAQLNRQLSEIKSHAVFERTDQAGALMESLVTSAIADLRKKIGPEVIDGGTMYKAAVEAVTASLPVGTVVYVAVDGDADKTGNVEAVAAADFVPSRSATIADCIFAAGFVGTYTAAMRAQKKSRD